MSKAFHSIDHNMLLDKLENIGVRGLPLKLFASYLSGRKQLVFCSNHMSNKKKILLRCATRFYIRSYIISDIHQ